MMMRLRKDDMPRRAERGSRWLQLLTIVFALWAGFASLEVYAQVARVTSVQGSVIVERAGQSSRIVGVGDSLQEKDVVRVARDSHVLLEFKDKSRITLRPNTVFRVDAFTETPADKASFGLSRGGIRAISGEMSKRNPDAVEFRVPNYILGVRGTEFDARLCERDCQAEERARPEPRLGPQAVARIIELKGTVTGAASETNTRELVPGAALYEREEITTGADAYVVLGFRDGSRVTLGERSRLGVLRFDYNDNNPQKGLAHLRLFSGSAQVWTGQLAKTGPDAYLFETGAGIIRPRGSGFAARVPPTGLITVAVWDGAVEVTSDGKTTRVDNGCSLRIGADQTVQCTVLAGEIGQGPRPDQVKVDPALFGGDSGDVTQGFYVWVRDGVVRFGNQSQVFDVTTGNSAVAAGNKIAALDAVPNFMRFDKTPRSDRPSAVFVFPFFKKPDGSIAGMCK